MTRVFTRMPSRLTAVKLWNNQFPDTDRAEKRLCMRHLRAVGGSSAGKSRLEQQISNVKSIAER